MSVFTDKVVVVTGASSGVGRAVARAFGAEGARVGLIARGREALSRAADEIVRAGGEALELPLDLADAAAVSAAADRVVAHWGAIDVWINNAMVSVFAPVDATTPAEYRRVLEVNYLGTVHGTLAALPHMRRVDRGTIIQIGSALAYRSIPLQSAYCASKAAIRAFTDSLRSELHHEQSGIAVTMLQLPAVNTPQFDVVKNKLGRHAHPVPPVYQPELIAEAVLAAAIHPRREMWLGWPAIKAIIGQHLAPGWLDRGLAKTAWDAQTTPQPERARADNVFIALPGDRGAHGGFDDESKRVSLAIWLSRHRAAFVAALALSSLALGCAAWQVRRAA